MNGPAHPSTGGQRHGRYLRRGFIVLASLAAIALVALVIEWTRFAYAKPTIARDFVAEAKERIATMPVEQGALPLIQRALVKEKQIDWTKPDFESAAVGHVRRDSPVWNELVNYVDLNAASIADACEATRRPWLGAPIELADESGFDQEPPLIGSRISPHLKSVQWAARLLAQATIVESERGRMERVSEFVIASSQLAKLAAQNGASLEQRITIKMFGNICELVTRDVIPKAGQLSQEQRDGIRRALRDFSLQDGKPISYSFVDERNAFLDIVQRVYTDDGSGDGRLLIVECDPFTKNVIAQAFGLATHIRPTSGFWQFPMAMWCATRAETVAAYDAITREAEIELETPPYKWAAMSTRADYTPRVLRTSRERKRHPILILATSDELHAATSLLVWDARQQQAACDVGFAIEQFRARERRVPKSLEELVPRDLDTLPIDMFDGKPLKYLVRGGEPLLYSVGPDGVDDGAAASFTCGWSSGPCSKDFVLYPYVPKPPEPENTDPNAK